jgi:branched-chain amino acid transport system permease protein
MFAILMHVLRQKRCLVVLGLMLVPLAACVRATPRQVSPTAAPGIYDGQWRAEARTADGAAIAITFNIRASTIGWLTYTYPGQGGQLCTVLVSAQHLPAIVNGGFSLIIPSNKTDIEGTFHSATSASGQVSFVDVESAPGLHCEANVSADWKGTKLTSAVPAPALAGSTSSCGQNVNCRDLLFQLLLFGAVNGAILALNAIGVTVVYSTVRTINLAQGDVFALATVLVTSIINLIGLDPGWAATTRWTLLAGILLAAILLGALLSVGVEQLAFRPFRGRSKLAPVAASLGLSFILYQVSLVWRAYQKSFIRGEHRSVPGLPEVPTDGIPNFLGGGNLLSGKVVLHFGDVFVFVVAILLVLVATWILFHTKLGSSIRAVDQNPDLALIVGVDRDRAIRHAFALGGALSGAAAFVFALYYSRPFGQAGAESGLTAFAAALLGGIGNPFGALLSGLLLGITGSMSDYFLRAEWTPILVLGLLTAVLAWRSGGLTGGGKFEQVSVRDSVVLTAAGESPRERRWLILLFVCLGLFPLLAHQFNWGGEILLRGAGIVLLLAFGLNILLGLSGVIDLGYAAGYAVGAYVAAILVTRFASIDFSIVLLASVGAALLFGLLKGVLAVRMQNDYLAVGTLALGLMTQRLAGTLDVTGGPTGLSNLPVPRVLGISLGSQTSEYYLVLVVVTLGAVVSMRLIRSRTGRAWLALSDDNTAATTFGINSGRYRLLAFVLSSAMAGTGGALYAISIRYIDPDVAAFYVSAMLLAMVVLGGAGSVTGVIVGVAIIYGYDRVIIPQLSALLAAYWPQNVYVGAVPNIRGTNFFNFGFALYLTVRWRVGRRNRQQGRAGDKTGPQRHADPDLASAR